MSNRISESRHFSGVSKRVARLAILGFVLGMSFVLCGIAAASANAAPTTMVSLGQASPYAVLSGASVGNTVSAPGAPHTIIRGDVGVKANAEPSGFPPGVVTGSIRFGSTVDPAHADLAAAYAEIATRPNGAVLALALVGKTIPPGLHKIDGAASNTGTVTLDGGGDPDAVFVIQVNGALAFAAGSHVVLTNGARASRVFWQVAGAGAVGANGSFAGTLIARDAVAMGAGTIVNGRAFARDGALTLDNNQFYGSPPVVTITGGAAAQTTDSTPTISGTTDVEAPATVTVNVAGENFSVTPVGGAWSVTSDFLPNGTYPVTASVTDGAGNPGSATQQLTVDTVLPVLAIDGGPSVSTNDATPTISGTTDAAVDTVVRVTVDAQHLRALVHSGGVWNIRPVALPDGNHDVSASVSDLAGNESSVSQVLTTDTTAPTISIAGGSAALTNDPTPEISGTVVGASGSTVNVDVGNETLSGPVGVTGNWAVTADSLADGPHRVVVSVSDEAGNRASMTQMLTIDTQAPLVTIDGGQNAASVRVDPTFSGTSDEAPGATVSVTVADKTMTALLQADGTWNTNAGFLGNGTWQVQASTSDAAGNTGTFSQTLRVGSSGPTGPSGPSDKAPEITRYSVAPAKVRLGRGNGNAIGRQGPSVKLTLSEDSRISFVLTRKFTKTRTFGIQAGKGASAVRIPKRIRQKIKRGGYRLAAVATDSIGQSSTVRYARFKVVR